MHKKKVVSKGTKMKKYRLRAKGINGTRKVAPREFVEVVGVSDKKGNILPSGNVSVRVGCPAVLEVESLREQERTLLAYDVKKAMIKKKMKEF